MNVSDSYKLVHTLRRRVASIISPYRSILLAFSGGLDSTILLDILVALRDESIGNSMLTLRAVYIHHGLSRYASDWATHCAQECHRRNVNFSIVHVVVDTKTKNIEASARDARYQALLKILLKNEVLLTAHNQDDQAETILLALKRGSGPSGLSAMTNDALYSHYRIIRPLLEFSRIKLKTYAQALCLQWIEDNSNTDLRFDRNFLRLCIIPSLCKRWPHFVNAAARSAKLCADQEKLIDELLAETLSEIIAPDGSLLFLDLITMSEIKRAALIRRWLANLGLKMPTQAQLVRIWQEVALSRRDSVALINIGNNMLVRRFRDRLYVVQQLPLFKDKSVLIHWTLDSEWLELPYGLGNIYRYQVEPNNNIIHEQFSVPIIVSNKSDYIESDIKSSTLNMRYYGSTASLLAIVRAPLSNELVSVRFSPVHGLGLLYIVGRRHGRSLKKIWQELNIPPWKRSSIPLLFYNDKLIAALGVFITRDGLVQEKHSKWYIFYQMNNK